MSEVVILFGSDGGGIVLRADGTIGRIPPYSPDLRHELAAINALVHVGGREGGLEGEARDLATKMADRLVTHVNRQTGNSNITVAFYDEGDGFTCGNGKRPRPFPPRGEIFQPGLEAAGFQAAVGAATV